MTCFEASFDALSVAEFTKCLASSSSAFSSSSFPSKAAATSSEASALFSSPKLSKHRPSVQCAQCQSGRHSTACSAARQASKSRFIASKTWAICSRMEPFSLSDGANKKPPPISAELLKSARTLQADCLLGLIAGIWQTDPQAAPAWLMELVFPRWPRHPGLPRDGKQPPVSHRHPQSFASSELAN
eukprot:CAMPEP_0206487758 /NCGR_PEP_ID=MMETSP0324_2-20121206/41886_1 /ASSEMBLY_ACC=CAM_ASM_000836 /TAXON_ID=2866 /ORGANISM="Crypthecodinium cohnii, Strain Seligo" /LENGTH=185 /DNA_ID=CAMNT_0053966409 /DNA_START=70 /DNA_END=628 /DNA_ORIENTATION=+